MLLGPHLHIYMTSKSQKSWHVLLHICIAGISAVTPACGDVFVLSCSMIRSVQPGSLTQDLLPSFSVEDLLYILIPDAALLDAWVRRWLLAVMAWSPTDSCVVQCVEGLSTSWTHEFRFTNIYCCKPTGLPSETTSINSMSISGMTLG